MLKLTTHINQLGSARYMYTKKAYSNPTTHQDQTNYTINWKKIGILFRVPMTNTYAQWAITSNEPFYPNFWSSINKIFSLWCLYMD
jgi:hypothetical protein